MKSFSFTVKLDNWKSFAALGLGIAFIISALKMSKEQLKEVSIAAVDACKEIDAEVLAD